MKLTDQQITIVLAALKMYRMDLYVQIKETSDNESVELFNELISKTADLSIRFESANEYQNMINKLKAEGQYLINGKLTEQAIEARKGNARSYRSMNPDRIERSREQYRARKAARRMDESNSLNSK